MATKVNAGKKGGSKMIWIIGGVLLVAGSVGLYYYMRKRKKDETAKTGDSQNKVTENKNTSTTNTTATSTDSTSTSGSTTTTTDSPSTSSSTNTSSPSSSNVGSFSLNTSERIKAFQDWMDKQGKGWIKKDGKWVLLNKGAGYGNNGANTQRAWKIFGAEYVKTLNSFEGNSAFSNFESSLNLDLY